MKKHDPCHFDPRYPINMEELASVTLLSEQMVGRQVLSFFKSEESSGNGK